MSSKHPSTVGSKCFNPDELFNKWEHGQASTPGEQNSFSNAVKDAFDLDENDSYVYHAMASVTLGQVQQAVDAGGARGLHAWYIDQHGQQISPPPVADIIAYTDLFSSTKSLPRALTGLKMNAKKESIRARVAQNLESKRIFSQNNITISKLKKPHNNPYFDFWAWSCRNLEWAGPDDSTVNVKQSHHLLPVLYHHFGCVCPSFESLQVIRQISNDQEIVEIGSGNGYWTYLLRRLGLRVTAVDNGDSIWRTMWIGDTIRVDGARYLSKQKGGKDALLLLVYPQASTDFTSSVLKAYNGNTVCIAGTQNANRFTGFQDMDIDDFMSKEKPGFQKVIQTPLPSFAGKDDALFVFQKETVR